MLYLKLIILGTISAQKKQYQAKENFLKEQFLGTEKNRLVTL